MKTLQLAAEAMLSGALYCPEDAELLYRCLVTEEIQVFFHICFKGEALAGRNGFKRHYRFAYSSAQAEIFGQHYRSLFVHFRKVNHLINKL